MPIFQTVQHLAQTTSSLVLSSSNTSLQITDILVQNNDDTNDIDLTIYHVKNSDPQTVSNKIFNGTILKGFNVSINPRVILSTGDELYVSASTANLLGLFINTWIAEE